MRLICCVAACALALHAQGWPPKRIVAITDYVPLARQARIAGDVEIKCTLAEDGSVTSAEAVSGHPLLKEQARQNALLWKFQSTSAPAAGKAKVDCRLHDLRHTAATKMAEAGIPESTMLAPMGHMSRAMLERYSHIRIAAKRAAVEALCTLQEQAPSNGVPTKVPTAEVPSAIQ